tara:strand:+ start:3630 stop:3803 length:174 start_codon:yes stop_codon:yes gene_type:complete
MRKKVHFDHGQVVFDNFEQFIYAVIQDMNYRMSRIEDHLDIEPDRNVTLVGVSDDTH